MRLFIAALLIPMLGLGPLACGGKDEAAGDAAPADSTAIVQEPAPVEGLVWLDFAEGQARAAAEGKPMLVDFWTTWCHWCKVMDKDTYSAEAIQKRLAESFITVKVNAESKVAQGGEGAPSGVDLARSFQVNSFPTTWFVDSQGEKIAPLPGFVQPEPFAVILDYISSGAYRTQKFQEYQASQGG